jgi:hypothetical protein
LTLTNKKGGKECHAGTSNFLVENGAALQKSLPLLTLWMKSARTEPSIDRDDGDICAATWWQAGAQFGNGGFCQCWKTKSINEATDLPISP